MQLANVAYIESLVRDNQQQAVHHAWTPPVCQALICDELKVEIAAMHPDFDVRREAGGP
jgi:hypothetical protein